MIRTVRYTGRTPQWAIVDPARPGGFVRTSDANRARRLAALYVRNWGTGTRDGWDYETSSSTEFNEILEEARIAHEGYKDTLRNAMPDGIGTSSADGFTKADREALGTVRTAVEAVRDTVTRIFR